MTKIEFKNLPDTTTPLSASNLNTLQDNVEDAINEKQDIPEDTGWVDLSSYVNTTNLTIRPGEPPEARRIGNQVFWRGSVFCTTAPGSKRLDLLRNIPNQFRPTQEISSAGVRYTYGIPFRIWYEGGNIQIFEENNIPTTDYYQGYALSSIGSYLVN